MTSQKGLVGIAALLTLLISGCSAGESGPPGKSADEVRDEYFDEAEKLELAPGWEWPDDPEFEETSEDGGGVKYEPGFGRVNAGQYWYCSWSRYFLAAEDEDERQAALAVLLTVTETYMYKVGYHSSTREVEDAYLEQIKVGDYTEFANSTDINCPASSA